jgi:2-polyprenyl-6-methoxyphenol hydroxylase-like FAD-dependent oxidoreductase
LELVFGGSKLTHWHGRIGYGPLFLERRKLLEIMADELQDRSAAKTSLRVVSANESSDGVTLALSDGHSITADLVIGADGVRSCVREAIDMSRPEGHVQANECKYSVSCSFHKKGRS